MTHNKYLVLYAMELGSGFDEESPNVPLACVLPCTGQLVNRLLDKLLVFHTAVGYDRSVEAIEFTDSNAVWIDPTNVDGNGEFLTEWMEEESALVNMEEQPELHKSLLEAMEHSVKVDMPKLTITRHGAFWSAYYENTFCLLNSIPINQREIEALLERV